MGRVWSGLVGAVRAVDPNDVTGLAGLALFGGGLGYWAGWAVAATVCGALLLALAAWPHLGLAARRPGRGR